MKYRGKLISLIVFIFYLLMIGFAYLIWGDYGYQAGVISCLTISSIFLILFLSLIMYYYKKVEGPLKMNMILTVISIFIGLCWSILRYTDASEMAIMLLYVWSATLIIGFAFLIYSFFEFDRKKLKEELWKEILEELGKT